MFVHVQASLRTKSMPFHTASESLLGSKMQEAALTDILGDRTGVYRGYPHRGHNESVVVVHSASQLLEAARQRASHIELRQHVDATGLYLPSSREHMLGRFLLPGIESITVRRLRLLQCSLATYHLCHQDCALSPKLEAKKYVIAVLSPLVKATLQGPVMR